ncbi:MAG: hypothetical protein OET90_03085 [Desulfuromonadales bacterium]|nr:hypothetical protein [Desulfuromonadales bacterium]
MRFFLTLLLLFTFVSPAFSGDMLITWQTADGHKMKVAHRDDNHVRMQTTPDAYTLLTGDKIYMVSKSDDGWQVMDYDQMAGLAAQFGGSQAVAEIGDYKAKYKKTGKTEKIAGYKGTVYQVTVRDGSGKVVQDDQVVFSKSGDVKRASKAMMLIAAKMGDKMGAAFSQSMDEAMQQAQNNSYGGALRYGKDMKVVSIDKKSLPGDYFKLPQNAKQVEMPQQAPSQQQKKSGGFFGDVFGDSKEAAKDEAHDSTVDEVREGVRKAFGSLFD